MTGIAVTAASSRRSRTVKAADLVITRVRFDPSLALRASDELAYRAMRRALERIKARADELVPHDTGVLMGTGRIALRRGRRTGRITYRKWYAAILRAHPEWDYGDRSPDWVRRAFDDEADAVGRDLEQTFRTGSWT